MPRLALALCFVFFVSLFVFRSVVQFRKTGSTGVKGFSGRIGSLPWLAGVTASLGLVLAPVAPLAAIYGWPGGGLILSNAAVHYIGAAFAVAGIGGALLAQLSMGNSWRVGVDESEVTDLVTSGLFAWVRNPIFTFIWTSLLGLVLLVPNGAALLAAALTVIGIELQVRAVEEPYLEQTHGDTYRSYAARVGRFLPGIGLWRRGGGSGAHAASALALVALLSALTWTEPASAEPIRGRVTEAASGIPLPAVSVVVEPNGERAETDEDGSFEVEAHQPRSVRLEYPGWKPETVAVQGRSEVATALEPDAQPMRPNFDNTESIVIDASPAAIWAYVTNYETNWMNSNPEHISVRFLAEDKTFRNGIRFVLSEHVGNGRADQTGYLTDVVPNETYTWVSRAVYTGYGGFSVRVDQTGTFSLEPFDGGVLVSHRIQAAFPDSFWGQVARFVAENLGDAAGDAALHTRIELEYFKEQIERLERAQNG